MAHRPLQARSEYVRLPIPELSEIKRPVEMGGDLPVDGMPQDMRTYNRGGRG